tara:strand:- start:2874 stop:3134 length:261 start_codon:yes stop_codon:yes gene_type:complete
MTTESEIKMYGCTKGEILEGLDFYKTATKDTNTAVAFYSMSILSDVQEVIAYPELARQYVNKVKFLLRTQFIKDSGNFVYDIGNAK